MIVGMMDGSIMSHTARDPLAIGRQYSHTSVVTALVGVCISIGSMHWCHHLQVVTTALEWHLPDTCRTLVTWQPLGPRCWLLPVGSA